jgi:hypothetical protein
MENVVIFYGQVFDKPFDKGILWPFGTFCGQLVYFFKFWHVVPINIWYVLVCFTKKNLATLLQGAELTYVRTGCFNGKLFSANKLWTNISFTPPTRKIMTSIRAK